MFRQQKYKRNGVGNRKQHRRYVQSIGAEGNVLVFVLLIIPAVLISVKTFSMMRNVSIAGLAAKIIFIMGMSAKLSDSQGTVEMTPNNFLIVVIYVALVAFTIYCEKNAKEIKFIPNDFNSMTLVQKKDFIAEQRLIQNKTPEQMQFLNDCIHKYNEEVRSKNS